MTSVSQGFQANKMLFFSKDVSLKRTHVRPPIPLTSRIGPED